ncbi:MAG: aldose 1-epimerase [Planctomycetales bacterium]
MTVITLRDQSTGAQAQILTELGFNCFSFQAAVNGEVHEVLDAPPEYELGKGKASSGGIPILFPFPSRIRGGKFSWKNRNYELPAGDGKGNAIHGLVLDRPWRVTLTDDQTAVGEFQLSVDAPDRVSLWPTDFLIEVRYTLHPSKLRADVRMANAGEEDLPWGLGTHPYFKAPLGPKGSFENCVAQLAAPEIRELVELLPTGRRLPVEPSNDLQKGGRLKDLQLDHLFTGITPTNGRMESLVVDPHSGLQVAQYTDPIFTEWVVYTPPHHRSICLEPYTCMTDAINMRTQGIDTGWKVMKPGKKSDVV